MTPVTMRGTSSRRPRCTLGLPRPSSVRSPAAPSRPCPHSCAALPSTATWVCAPNGGPSRANSSTRISKSSQSRAFTSLALGLVACEGPDRGARAPRADGVAGPPSRASGATATSPRALRTATIVSGSRRRSRRRSSARQGELPQNSGTWPARTKRHAISRRTRGAQLPQRSLGVGHRGDLPGTRHPGSRRPAAAGRLPPRAPRCGRRRPADPSSRATSRSLLARLVAVVSTRRWSGSSPSAMKTVGRAQSSSSGNRRRGAGRPAGRSPRRPSGSRHASPPRPCCG